MTAHEQQLAGSPQRMSGVLWDLFSGSASYTNVLVRTLHPAYIGNLLWNLVSANVRGGKAEKNGRADPGAGHVGH
jgi:hypothetical protein